MKDVVEVEGLRIAYERAGAGAGDAVVLLHGFVGDGSATWAAQIEDLGQDHAVVAWDAPGAGASTRPPDGFGIHDYAATLEAFLGEIGVVRCHVVGLSFGGIVALALAASRPRLVASLALIGAYAGWRGSLGDEAAAERLRGCAEAARLAPDEFAARMLPSMFARDAGPAAEGFRASVAAYDPAGFMAMARACRESDLREDLARIEAPTLVMVGEADARAPVAVAEAIHAGIRGSRLVVLPGVGHVATVEAPQVVNRELRSFLSKVAGSG